VRHITPEGLDTIDELLEPLRTIEGLTERSRGVFYRRSQAFLHFHEDGADIYADVKLDGHTFDRRRATTKPEQRALLAAVRRALAPGPTA